jgi:hypothetical protein
VTVLLPMRFALAALALLSMAAAPARARVTVGEILESAELGKLGGGKDVLVSRTATVSIVLFWRPGHERSQDTLKQMAECEKVFAGKSIHMVAVVSGSYAPEDVKAAVEEAGLHVPVLVDQGDALYGKLEIRQHPLVVVAEPSGRIQLAQPYVRIRYCDIVRAHVRYLLKEIDQAQLELALHPPRAAFPNDDKRNIVKRYVTMGRREAAAGHCDKALLSFGKALEILPQDRDALEGVQGCDPGAQRRAEAAAKLHD